MKFFSAEKITPDVHELHAEIAKLKQIVQENTVATEYAFLFPSSPEMRTRIQLLAQEKRALQPTMLVLVGIGGSSLGAIAVHEALKNSRDNEIQCLYADTIDTAYTAHLYAQIEQELAMGGTVLLVIVSKSGTTTETMVNAALFSDLLKHYKPENYAEHIVIISDADSVLHHIAQQHAYDFLAVPQQLGGRFSVFSAVGLFPLALLGYDIDELCAGAQNAINNALLLDQENVAAQSACALYRAYQQGKHIHDTFVFSPCLAHLAAWYRQLLGESIGKRHDKEGKEVCVGLTPTVSVGSNDLHSVAQLYLAGPYDKITTFISCAANSPLKIPRNEFSGGAIACSVGKSISVVQNAILHGTQAAYTKDKRPFMSIELAALSEFELGSCMQMKMFEIVFLGYLLEVNVFDQPQVELYKKETRKLLEGNVDEEIIATHQFHAATHGCEDNLTRDY